MSESAELLILAVNEGGGELAAYKNGKGRHLRSMKRPPEMRASEDPLDANAARSPQDRARHIFACQLTMAIEWELSRVRAEELVLLADRAMLDELREVRTSATARLRVREVPDDHPCAQMVWDIARTVWL